MRAQVVPRRPPPRCRKGTVSPDFASQLLKPRVHSSAASRLGEPRPTRGDPPLRSCKGAVPGAWGRSSRAGSPAPRAAQLQPCGFRPRERESTVGGSFLCKLFCPLPPPALSTRFSAPGVQPRRPRCLGVATRGAAPGSAALGAGARARRPEPMAEAGRSPAGLPGEPAEQAAAAPASESEAPAPPPASALRWLPGDLSPRGRSQSDLSSSSSRGRPLRVHISGSGKGGLGRGRWRASSGQVAERAMQPARGASGHQPGRLVETG